jgi:hypothetical protein
MSIKSFLTTLQRYQSLNVVENAEFRNLLTFFREDYTDEDMPHRSKIRVAILDAWRNWFGQLKQELKVSTMITAWIFLQHRN